LPEFPLMKIMVFYHAGFGRSLSAYSHWTRRNYFPVIRNAEKEIPVTMSSMSPPDWNHQRLGQRAWKNS